MANSKVFAGFGLSPMGPKPANGLILTTGRSSPTKRVTVTPQCARVLSLRACLRQECFNGQHRTLGYEKARVSLYNYIDNHAGQVACVYGTYVRDIPYGQKETNPWPINCEHTLPQSAFRLPNETYGREPLRSDLFPTHNILNAARASYDFGELNDVTETVTWYGYDAGSVTIPTSKIETYSELSSTSVRNLDYPRWEPREAHKGQLTRALAYMYTMYENELIEYAALIRAVP